MRICGVGDNVIDRYLHCGQMFPGGNALNFAVFGRQAGAHAAYLGVTGNDIPAGVIHHALCAEEVDISRLRINESFNALSQIDLDDEGNRFFVGSVPPPYQLQLSNEDLKWLQGFDLLHTSDYSQIEEQLPALAACAPLSFDFGARDDAWAEPLLRWVQVATFSRSGSSPEAAGCLIEKAHTAGVATVLITQGANGALISHRGEQHYQPALAAKVVDTLGAGDAFIATLLVALGQGHSLTRAAYKAAQASGRVCERLGAFGCGVPLTPLPPQAKQQY
ncbi:PfkB family carbohydrate kinase [Pantoea osteomyelitidis]|uniref:PfkB family carbohydrate kinase n=1 Tax=Pantoea osteomyelitidis TaxID=3230026 RepID=A0ABW7Q197_9GAMM